MSLLTSRLIYNFIIIIILADPLSEDCSLLPSLVGERRLFVQHGAGVQHGVLQECVLLCHWLGRVTPPAHVLQEWQQLLHDEPDLTPELLYLLPHIITGAL